MPGKIRRSPQRARTLAEIVADADAGSHYRHAAGIDPRFLDLLLDGGYVTIREEGQHPLGGPAHHLYPTADGRELLKGWQS